MWSRGCNVKGRSLVGALGILMAGTLLGGCAQSSVASTSAPLVLLPRVTPTPAVTVRFSVALATPVAAAPRCPLPGGRPNRTSGSGPALVLGSTIGPPLASWIQVRGERLQPVSSFSVVWMTDRGSTPISTTYWTGPHGFFQGTFHVPAAPPGEYRIGLLQNGTLLATAPYEVFFPGGITARVKAGREGETMQVTGTCFQPHARLVLLAYTLDVPTPVPHVVHGKKVAGTPVPLRPIVLGKTQVNGMGKFEFVGQVHLNPGQYHLETASVDDGALEVADTVVDVNE